MRKFILIIFFVLSTNSISAAVKDKIILNLENTDNISFKFEQNINGNIENGNCIIQYPKKIYCKYNLDNQKILVSNGKLLVIKTKTSYYLYPLEKTPLNSILNKNFLLNKIKELKERTINDKFINFTFVENDNEINVFFNKINYNLIGWQTLDIYQNLSITFISSVERNKKFNDKIFNLPKQN